MKRTDDNEQDVSVFTGISSADNSSWVSSLVRQIKELREERKNPPAPVEITAERDLSALDNLLETRSSTVSLFQQIRSVIHDIRHPHKTETTAELVEVEEIWSKHKTGIPSLLSIGVHALIIVLAIIPWATTTPPPADTTTSVMVYTPTNLVLNLPQTDEAAGGGGGGGRKELTPPSLGQLPRPAEKQLAPPDPEPPKNLDPDLIVEPTVVAPQLAALPQVSILNLGDPQGVAGPPSAGPGVGGGIGSGQGRGVGEGQVPGVGPGEGGGFGGGVFRVGGGVTAPTILSRVEPQYSEEARKSRFQGTVLLEAIVRKDGTVQIVRVVRSLGFGLDENAIEALAKWRFRPGMRNGTPVDVSLNIEVNFNLR